MEDNYLWINLPNINKILLIADNICISGQDKSVCLDKWVKFKKLKGTVEYNAMRLSVQETIDIWQDLERLQIRFNMSGGGNVQM